MLLSTAQVRHITRLSGIKITHCQILDSLVNPVAVLTVLKVGKPSPSKAELLARPITL